MTAGVKTCREQEGAAMFYRSATRPGGRRGYPASWLIGQSLWFYLMLYVTADLFLDRRPTFAGHVITWVIIASWWIAAWGAAEYVRRRDQRYH